MVVNFFNDENHIDTRNSMNPEQNQHTQHHTWDKKLTLWGHEQWYSLAIL